MRYNISPFELLLDETVPSHEEWKRKFHSFFNGNHNGEILDYYYDILMKDFYSIKPMLQSGYFIDEYSGIFSFNTNASQYLHTFHLANFIRRNHIHFNKKKIQTYTMDYGVVNIQIKQCGLELVGGSLPPTMTTGATLSVIGNECSPYVFGTYIDLPECDVMIVSDVFRTEDEAERNWNFLKECRSHGMEVFFSSNTFFELKKFVDYDKIKQVENPTEIYDDESYSNLEYGYSKKIYQLI